MFQICSAYSAYFLSSSWQRAFICSMVWIVELSVILKQKTEYSSKSKGSQGQPSFIIILLIKPSRMKGKPKQTPIFLEIGKNLAREQRRPAKQTYSFFQNSHHTSQHVTTNKGQQISLSSTKRKCSITQNSKLTRPGRGRELGMNDQFLQTRKENHLNTHFNLRKMQLRQISKQNKQLLERIHSQKSLYSSIELNKSFEEAKKVKNRLSQSKLSQRSNSSRSQRSTKGSKPLATKQPKIQIKTSSINQVLSTDLNNFKGLFTSTNQQRPKEHQPQRQLRSYSNNGYRNKEQYARMSLKPISKPPTAVSQDSTLNMGGLLHRIQEQMKPGVQKAPSKKIRGYMRPKGIVF